MKLNRTLPRCRVFTALMSLAVGVLGCSVGAPVRHIDPAMLKTTELRDADFAGVQLPGAQLAKRDMRKIVLRHANLAGADLREVDLTEADLRGANLAGADLRWAILMRADLRGANLEGATFYGDSSAGNFGANLRHTDLRKTNLQKADLRGVSFEHADLRLANLRDADLRGADLAFATLEGAKIKGANFKEARYVHDTKFPGAFDPQAEGLLIRVGKGDFFGGGMGGASGQIGAQGVRNRGPVGEGTGGIGYGGGNNQ